MDYTYEDDVELITIHGRTYRKSVVAYPKDYVVTGSAYVPGEETSHQFDDVEIDSTLEFTKDPSGRWFCEFSIDPSYYGRILGAKGKTKKGIERSCKVSISVPSRGSSSKTIGVSAEDKRNIMRARSRIMQIVEQSQDKEPYTHFLSIPLNANDVQESLRIFFAKVSDAYLLDDSSTPAGLHPSIFADTAAVHLTLFMLRLSSPRQVSLAAETLRNAHAAIYDMVNTRTKFIQLRGLDVMKGSPTAAHVVYAKVDEMEDSVTLGRIREYLWCQFERAGLVRVCNKEELKLHATLFNTRHRNREASGGKSRQLAFDASGILVTFGTYDFGAVRCESIQLSQRFKHDGDGYYQCVEKINLP